MAPLVLLIVWLKFVWGEIDTNSNWDLAKAETLTGCALYPQESETRDLHRLDGIWTFRLNPNDQEYGFKNKWYEDDLAKSGPVINMPVPASYNDITVDARIRDHVGLVWYDRRFFVPDTWSKADYRVWLRFSSVDYKAQVWINGQEVMYHEIGHLPFEREVTKFIHFGASNLLTVACDNTLLPETVPQGYLFNLTTDAGSKVQQSYTFDFFNYAGIQRSVFLYTTPSIYIDDITVNTDIDQTNGLVAYDITYKGAIDSVSNLSCVIELLDKENKIVGRHEGAFGTIVIPNAHFWWPYLMNEEVAYLYTLQVSLFKSSQLLDVAREKIGIRKVSWTNKTLSINNQNIYMRGFGRHEDSFIRGKGLDYALFTKDYSLMKWVGANSYRTSHYPYAEELYYLADQEGIMIIDECPSVNTEIFSDGLLQKHKDSLTELIKRDKNHPSVIMWSIANEPRSQDILSDAYFGKVAAHVRLLDLSRPITIVNNQALFVDHSAKHADVLSFNRYNSWYQNTGQLDTVTTNVIQEARDWHNEYNKPVFMAEYGADTLAGVHLEPESIWSEEFQVSMMSRHFEAFDKLRSEGFFVGEFIWNFADFATAQNIIRMVGNKKGIFTRERQPKASAHHLRKRYFELAQTINNMPMPKSVYSYIIGTAKTEL